MITGKDMFIKEYNKLEQIGKDLLNKYDNDFNKKIDGKTFGDLLDEKWWEYMFCNPTVALFLKENNIICWSFVEFQMKCDDPDGPCARIKTLYKLIMTKG